MRFILVIIFSVSLLSATMAQERVTTFGFQFKPIVPSSLFKTGSQLSLAEGIEYRVDQRVGFAFGGVVRKGLTKNISFETGINYVHREYRASAIHQTSLQGDSTKFSIIGYEMPITALVFVKLSRKIYMDGAFGLAANIFPSEVGSGDQYGLEQNSFRNPGRMPLRLAGLQSALVTNVGFEYRTEKSGYFYLGASYHRPFRPIYYSNMKYEGGGANVGTQLLLNGNYLTIDLKYFFFEPQQAKQAVED